MNTIIKVNRNYFWAEVAVQTLVRTNVHTAVLCPGSRNTPLNIAFANNPSIKTYVMADERSAGYFALGLARKLNEAVAIVTTSGTAVAELFPAVLESFYQRIPLIVFSADRPPELLNTGANQTINQKNLFRNCIRNFYDISLPDLTVKKINQLVEFVARAAKEAAEWKKGPIQLNFPFRKPLEPFTLTDEMEESLYDKYTKSTKPAIYSEKKRGLKRFEIMNIINSFLGKKKGIITVGPGDYDELFYQLLGAFSDILGFPIFAEAVSGVPYNSEEDNNIINNFDSILRYDKFVEKFDPEVIIHFGKAVVSNSILELFNNTSATKILINEFDDTEDPSRTPSKVYHLSPSTLIKVLLEESPKRVKVSEEYMAQIKKLNQEIDVLKEEVFENIDINFEGKIFSEFIKSVPPNSNIFLSNSTVIREASFFETINEKNLKFYHNRGTSGIDGLISSCAGISAASDEHTYLFIGDIAFFHDLNGLQAVSQFTSKMHIIIVNNNGGGIFELLPISKLENHFEELFKTPQNLKFEHIAKGFGLKLVNIKDTKDFANKIKKSEKAKNSEVFNIITDSKESVKLRRFFWGRSQELIQKLVDEDSL